LLYSIANPAFRVQFFRLRAAYDRYKEEQEILEAEFARTSTWFTKTADNWASLANDCAQRSAGWIAFANDRSAMYRALADKCRSEWEKKHYSPPSKPLKRSNPESDV
jgi:hypothetical protein